MTDRFLNSIAKRFQLLNKEEQLPMPDEALWGAISENIQRVKSRKRFVPIWWPVGLWVIFLVVGLAIYHYVTPLGTQVQEDKAAIIADPLFTDWKTSVINHLDQSKEMKGNLQSSKSVKQLYSDELKQESVNQTSKKRVQEIGKEYKSNQPLADQQNWQKETDLFQNVDLSTKVAYAAALVFSKGNFEDRETEIKKASRPILTLEDLDHPIVLLEYGYTTLNAPEITELTTQTSLQGTILQIGAALPLYSNLENSYSGSGPQLSESIQNERRISLGIQKQLSDRWLMGLGFQHTVFDLVSQYEVDINYASAQEQLHGDTYSIVLDHTLPTSLGDVQTTTVLGRSSDTPIESTELVGLDISYTQRRSIIQIPLTASYRVIGGLHIFGGLTPGITLTDRLTAEVVSHHNKIGHHNSYGKATKHQGEFSLQSVIGVGCSLPMGSSWILGAYIGSQSDVVNGYYQTTNPQPFSAIVGGINLGYRL